MLRIMSKTALSAERKEWSIRTTITTKLASSKPNTHTESETASTFAPCHLNSKSSSTTADLKHDESLERSHESGKEETADESRTTNLHGWQSKLRIRGTFPKTPWYAPKMTLGMQSDTDQVNSWQRQSSAETGQGEEIHSTQVVGQRRLLALPVC